MAASGHGDDVARWLEAEGIVPAGDGAGAIADVPRVRGLLVEAARAGRVLSYAEMLGLLGHRFTRPKMRALCRTFDAIDRAGAAAGEPGLAVLVVRASDGLPGQGWWLDAPTRRGWTGAWEGEAALAFVRGEQERAFAWHRRSPPERVSHLGTVRAEPVRASDPGDAAALSRSASSRRAD